MLVGFMMIAAVALFVYTANLLMEKRNVIEATTVGAAFCFMAHVIVSYGFFLFDNYTPLNVAGTVLAVGSFGAAAAVAFKRKIVPQITADIKDFIIPLIIIALLIPFSVVKNQYYGLGQDEGGYQTQVLMFLNGDTKREYVFDEYYTLNGEYGEAYLEDVNDLIGMDSPNTEAEPPVRLMHGIPTYSALLASWASMFGYSNMQGIMTVFYALCIMLSYMCARNLKMDKVMSTLAAVLVGFSPAVIWVSKSAFTEGFTALAILLFIYLVTSEANRFWSLVPVVAFACFHMTFFVMTPMFIGVFGIIYFFSRDKKDMALLLTIPPISILSYVTMVVVQPTYTQNNYMKVFRKLLGQNVPDLDLAVMIVELLYIIVIVLLITALKFFKKTTLSKVRDNMIFGIVLRVLFVLPALYVIFNLLRGGISDGKRELLTNALQTSLWQYVVASGIVVSLIAAVAFLIKPSKIFENMGGVVIAVMFFYAILINASVLNKSVTSFFYYTRYMVPYIAVAVLFVLYMLKDMPKPAVIPAALIGLCIFVPTNINLAGNVDDTMVEWSTINDLSEIIGENDKVIVDEMVERQMWMPVKTMTGAKVYPMITDDMLSEAASLGSDTYFITSLPYYQADRIRELSLVYHDTFTCVGDDHPETNPVTLYPTKFDTYEEEIYVYKYSLNDHREYPILHCYSDYEGLAGSEHDYAWTGEEEVTLNCELYSRPYVMTVRLKNLIPFWNIGRSSLDVEVYANDSYITTVTLSSSSNYDNFVVLIPGEALYDGANRISFKSELWDASLNNPDDHRQIGFAINNVIFDAEVN